MKNKYHVSTSGFLSQCEAKIRACPRGQHFDQQEFVQMTNNHDPRIFSRLPAGDGYFKQAHDQYVEASKAYYSPKVQNYRKEEMKKLGVDSDSLGKVSEDYFHSYGKLGKYVRRFLVKNGIGEFDINTISRAMTLSKHEDVSDSENNRLANEAIDKLLEDPKHNRLRETFKAFEAKKQGLEELHAQLEKRFDREETTKRMRQAEKELHKAKLWHDAGIPEGSTEVTFANLDPDMLSYGPNGVNNLWAQGPRNMVRIIDTDGKWLYGHRARVIDHKQSLVLTPKITEEAGYDPAYWPEN